MNGDNLTLRAYVRIMDDGELEPYRRELVELLDTPSGCLDVVASTTRELVDYGAVALFGGSWDEADTMSWVRDSLSVSGIIHATVLA
jgi:hypothetical protein